jgi:hypothetical protein
MLQQQVLQFMDKQERTIRLCPTDLSVLERRRGL